MARSDSLLISLSQSGDSDAFAELWKRHIDAARWAAQTIAPDADADDIIQETCLQLFTAMRREPDTKIDGPFRALVYVTVRRVIDSTAIPATVPLSLQLQLNYLNEFTDDLAEHSLVSTAYTSLSEDWRTILWYTEVEQLTPAEIAPILGTSPNAIAALSYRAREGLKAAWLQAHIQSAPSSKDCGWTAQQLGSFARGTLSPRKTTKVSAHLTNCSDCTLLVHEVNLAAQQLRAVALIAALGLALSSPLIKSALVGAGSHGGLGASATGSITGGVPSAIAGAVPSGAVATGSSAFAATAVPVSTAGVGAGITVGGAITAMSAIAATLALGATFMLSDSSAALPGTASSDNAATTAESSGPQQTAGFFGQSAHFVANTQSPDIQPNDPAHVQTDATNHTSPQASGVSASDNSASSNGARPLKQSDQNTTPNTTSPNTTNGSAQNDNTTTDKSEPNNGGASSSGSTQPNSNGTGGNGASSSGTDSTDAGEPSATNSAGQSPSGGESPTDTSTTQAPDKSDPTTEPTAQSTGFAPSAPTPSGSTDELGTFTAARVNETSPGAPYFSGAGPQVGLIEVQDEYGTVVGSVVIGHDYRWGLRVIDSYTQYGKTTMTYDFYLTDSTVQHKLVKTLTVGDLTSE